jgi:hypothetical protein
LIKSWIQGNALVELGGRKIGSRIRKRRCFLLLHRRHVKQDGNGNRVRNQIRI